MDQNQDRDNSGQLWLWKIEAGDNVRLAPTRCNRCSRRLTRNESILRKLGPVCCAKLGVVKHAKGKQGT